MKLHQLICEETSVTLPKVNSLKDLKDPATKKYYTGVVNVTGDVKLNNQKLTKLPVKFGTVGGDFQCMASLRMPSAVMPCLTSLEGAPTSVGKNFACNWNKLTSLEGGPSFVGGYFYCYDNQLTSLQGAPSSVGSDFSCGGNKLTSLEGIHKIIKIINGNFYCQGPTMKNSITSGGIGLILIEGLKGTDANHPAFKIIEKYLGQGKKGLLYCQDELIEAGYEEFARL
jgi:hypothetical protein